MSERTIQKTSDVMSVLQGVTFAPSCVDMAWAWEIESTVQMSDDPLSKRDSSRPVPVVFTGGGWLIRCSFQRPDRETGDLGRGFGRWWYVRNGESESGLVKTAYSAAKMNIEHELMEAFRYRGVRIFDPHHTIDQLGLAAGVDRGH